jgi:hypothetical protein
MEMEKIRAERGRKIMELKEGVTSIIEVEWEDTMRAKAGRGLYMV